MRYVILLIGDESIFETMSEAEAGEMMAQFGAFDEWCASNGVAIVGGEELQPSRTATNFLQDGTVTDGPYLEVKEQLGGLYVIEVDSVELAREAAKHTPNYGVVQLWPVVEHPEE